MHPGPRRPAVFASILATAALAASLAAADEEPPDSDAVALDIVFVDLCDTPPHLRHWTLREIQGLLAPVGVRVTGWTAWPGESGPTGGIYVVLMPFDPGRSRTHPTGGVARRESGRQLAVWAFPPWVAGSLGLELGQAPRWTFRQRVQFERAMAVVVVHELAHALAGAKHRPTGLMSPSLQRTQLLDPRLALDADLYPAFRAAAARLDSGAGHAAADEAPRQPAASPR